jgi:prepilin-type N-terminal cleavage/methylation domain-containing protein
MIRPGASRLRGEHGMTIVELVIVIAVLAVLAALAIAYLVRARVAGNEASALGSLRTINTAQFAYAVQCGNGHYATSLLILGHKPSGYASAFLNEDLGLQVAPSRSGYTIRMRPGAGNEQQENDCQGNPTWLTYYVSAGPDTDNDGTRAFATNQGGAIFQLQGSTPPQEPFGPPAVPSQ